MIIVPICASIFFVLTLPSLVIVLGSFTVTGYVSASVPMLTLEWYRAFFANKQFVESLFVSLQVALASSLFSCLIGTFIAICVSRYNFVGKVLLEALFTLPLMMPLIVLGLSFMLFFTSIGLSGGIASLIIAHIIITTPYVVRLVRASFSNYNWNLERAAESLGASPAHVFFYVTAPLIMPGIFGGALLAFIVSFDDAVVALFLSSSVAVTLPVRIFNYIEQSPGPIVAAAGSMLVFFSLVAMFLVEYTVGTRAAFNISEPKQG